ncbi:MAG: cytochrome c oxidase subunit 3 [Actinomycetota bacterium]
MTTMSETTAPGTPIHREDVDVVGRRWRLGVGLIIVADASFVAAMLFGYRYLRGLNTEGAWVPQSSATAPIWTSWLLAAGLVLSAVVFRWGERGIRRGDSARLVLASAVGVLLLLVVSVGQVVQITNFPFAIADSAYASTMYLLAGANLFHLVLTLFLGVSMWNRGRLGRYTVTENWQVGIVSLWWAWVALAAVCSALTTSFVASPATGG